MPAKKIDGKQIAEEIHAEIRRDSAELLAKTGIVPGLATVLVGADPASISYVTAKKKACERDGIRSIAHDLAWDVSQGSLLDLLQGLRDDPAVHGILVQLPLPGSLDERAILDAIPVHKDVDGFHPANLGRLGLRNEEALFTPCTPAGVIEILKRSAVEIGGKNAVVVGRSKIVGLPVSLLLLRESATVTVCHSQTKDLAETTRRADILVCAIGRPAMITGSMVKEGAVVIDVGVNRVEDASKKRGYRLVGDCAFDEVAERASLITPVPGGVGPLTIAMLMRNTLTAAKKAAALGRAASRQS